MATSDRLYTTSAAERDTADANPDSSITMMGADGTTITIGPPQIGTVVPDSGGGATWTPAPGDPGVDISPPEAGDMGGDAGPGGGPGRSIIR